MDIYTDAAQLSTGTYGVPGQFTRPDDEPVSEMGGVIWTSRAVRQMQGLQAIAHEYEAEMAERPLEERKVTLVVDGQLVDGQFVVDNVEARNHLSGLQATAVQGSKWGKMIIGAIGMAVGVILQLQDSNYDAAAYGVALALIVSSLESIFIDRIKKPDAALREQYQA